MPLIGRLRICLRRWGATLIIATDISKWEKELPVMLRRIPLTILIFLTFQGAIEAQGRALVVSPGSYVGGFFVPRGRVIVTSSFGNGYVTVSTIVPAIPFGAPYGLAETQVGVQVIGRGKSLRSAPEVDLSVVDLDLGPPPWAKIVEPHKRELIPAPKPAPEEAVKRAEPLKNLPPKLP